MNKAIYTKKAAIKFIENSVIPLSNNNEYITKFSKHFICLLKDVDYLPKHYADDVYKVLLDNSESLLRGQGTPIAHFKMLEYIVMITGVIRNSERFTVL